MSELQVSGTGAAPTPTRTSVDTATVRDSYADGSHNYFDDGSEVNRLMQEGWSLR
jgi:hypothetical protein